MAVGKAKVSVVVVSLVVGGCGGSSDPVATEGGEGGAASTSTGADLFGGASSTHGSGAGVCEADAAPGALGPVYLAIAFDVSGSMGSLDEPWHDPALKWEPVVAASNAFFTDPASSGINASLTFFPIGGDDDEARCDPASYAVPDVPMIALPSNAFGDAIAATGPWGYGTPTLAVVGGLLDFIQPMALADPDASHAMVLVTDGYPQGCTDASIGAITDAVAAVADQIPTFVVGVANPPGGPDTVTDLDAIAVAGGTDHAYFVQTGDPEQTKADFMAAIEQIQQGSVACEIDIPAVPGGEPFDPEKVNVTHTSGGNTIHFVYDETCASEGSWHYDDPAAPTSIVLCEGTCAQVKADPASGVHVEFGCETIDVAK